METPRRAPSSISPESPRRPPSSFGSPEKLKRGPSSVASTEVPRWGSSSVGSIDATKRASSSLASLQPSVGIAKILRQNQKVDVVELDRSGHVQRRWVHFPDGRLYPVQEATKSNHFFFRFMRDWRKAIFDSFLPVGFPHSVSDDYLAYQTYDSLQAFFSTITSLLASRALLQGLGVGDANSSATLAMLITILKDAMSRIATILFAHRFGLRIEPDAKRYRFLADLFNDTAFFLELWSPYLDRWGKIAALSIGEGLRALCGVAAGASKAALSVHFAKHDNLAELNAKEASQETAVGLIGLLVGTLVVKYVEDQTAVLGLMVVLVLLHLWVNYLGVRSVCMTTLNRQRATILFNEFLSSNKLLTPAEVAARESVIFWSPVLKNQRGEDVARVEFAESYGHALNCGGGGLSKVYVLDGQGHTHFVPRYVPYGLTPVRMLLWNGGASDTRAAIAAWFKAVDMAWSMSKDTDFSEKQYHVFNESDPKDAAGPSTWDWALLCDRLERRGWDLGTQAFETTAPVRLTAQPAGFKED